MGRRVIIVEEGDGLFVKLAKGTIKVLYYVYVFPVIWLYRIITKKPAAPAALSAAAAPQLVPNVVVHVTAPPPSAAPVMVREVIKIRCPHCGGLVDQGVPKCPECGAANR
jgi:hypothetical protein